MTIYDKIVHQLMLHSMDLPNVSLYHGKMGIVLALYSYATRKRDEHLKEYAWDLLQTIYDELSDTLPYGIEWGLSGIGVGITLLKKYGVFDVDLNAVLADLDQRIMSYDPRRLTDFSYRSGVTGIYYYLWLRTQVESPVQMFDSVYLKELYQNIQTHGVSVHCLHHENYWYNELAIPAWSVNEYPNHPLDLDGGMSYFLISLMQSKSLS